MFEFLKPKEKYKNYYDCLIITPWSDFQSLDKYQKISAFTIEGINDKDTLFEIYKNNLLDNKDLSAPTKASIKNVGISLKEISYRKNRYLHLAKTIKNYWQKKELSMSHYWYFSTRADTGEEIKLNGIVEDKNNPLFDKHYPPNFFYDHTSVRAYRKEDIDKKHPNHKKFNDICFTPEPDFDFNIPEYIFEKFGVKQ